MDNSNKFHWTIEAMSHLRPADIDEIPVQHQGNIHSHGKWDREKEIQKDIDKFFTQKLVVPSPWAARELTKQVTFSPYPPMYITASSLLSPEQDTNMSIIDAAVQSEPCSQECKDELNVSHSDLTEEVEKLQDLSFTSLRRKLFEAPLETPNGEIAMSVTAELAEDGFDGLLVTTSGLESPCLLKQSRLVTSPALPAQCQCSPGNSPREASPLPMQLEKHCYGCLVADLSPIQSEEKTIPVEMSVSDDSGVLSIPLSPVKLSATREQDSSGCCLHCGGPSSCIHHVQHSMIRSCHSSPLGMSPNISVTEDIMMSVGEFSYRKPLATVSDNTPNRLRYDGIKDLPVKRLSSQSPDIMPKRRECHTGESAEGASVGLQNRLISSDLFAKEEQLKASLMFDTIGSLNHPHLSHFGVSNNRHWNPGHPRQSPYDVRSMTGCKDNVVASCSSENTQSDRASSPENFVRWRERPVQETKSSVSGMKN